jgi:uncharacterized protein (TIGR00730 family)
VHNERIVTVFGGSRPRPGEAEYEQVRELGRLLAGAGFAVCSGAYSGVMEAICHGAKQAGGKTYGVVAEEFGTRKANRWVDTEVRVATWKDRLFELIRLGDAYVACKGGTGTLVELSVVWEMMAKAVMPVRPLVVVEEFWKPVIESVRNIELSDEQTSGAPSAELVHCENSPAAIARYLQSKL